MPTMAVVRRSASVSVRGATNPAARWGCACAALLTWLSPLPRSRRSRPARSPHARARERAVKVPVSTVYALCREERIPHLRVGRRIVFERSSLGASGSREPRAVPPRGVTPRYAADAVRSPAVATRNAPASSAGVVGAVLVVEVARGRAHVRVAHPRLHLDLRRAVDRERAEGVAQVVEAQRAQAGGLLARAGSGAAAPRRPGSRRRCRRRPGRRPRCTHRAHQARQHLGDARARAARPSPSGSSARSAALRVDALTRIELRAKSTSRQRSAMSSPRRSPVNAAVLKIAASCSLPACADERLDLLGRIEVVVGRVDMLADTLDVGDRVWMHVVATTRQLEDGVQDRRELVRRSR